MGTRRTVPLCSANLKRRPKSLLEATDVARAIRETLRAGGRAGWLLVGDNSVAGSYVRDRLSSTGAAGVRNPDLASTLLALSTGMLRLPRQRDARRIPIALLSTSDAEAPSTVTFPDGPRRVLRAGLGTWWTSPDAEKPPTYPALWAHRAESERSFVVQPDRAGRVREGCEELALDRWNAAASRLHFNLDFRINSQSLAACLTPEPVIGGRAWPSFFWTAQSGKRPSFCGPTRPSASCPFGGRDPDSIKGEHR